MPIEIINQILSFSSIKCKTCIKKISLNDLSNLIYFHKYYYCCKKCFNHI